MHGFQPVLGDNLLLVGTIVEHGEWAHGKSPETSEDLSEQNLIGVISYSMNWQPRQLAMPSPNSPLSTFPSHPRTRLHLPHTARSVRCIQ